MYPPFLEESRHGSDAACDEREKNELDFPFHFLRGNEQIWCLPPIDRKPSIVHFVKTTTLGYLDFFSPLR